MEEDQLTEYSSTLDICEFMSPDGMHHCYDDKGTGASPT